MPAGKIIPAVSFPVRWNLLPLARGLLAVWLLQIGGIAADQISEPAMPPGNPVERTVQVWERRLAREDVEVEHPLEEALRAYFKQFIAACVRVSDGDTRDITKITGRARLEVAADRERLIRTFVDAGYKRRHVEVYLDRLYTRMSQELAVFFWQNGETTPSTIKPAPAPAADELVARSEELFYEKKDYGGAIKALEDALRFAPSNVRLTLEAALRQQAAGRFTEARANFDLARQLYPKIVNIYIGLGAIRTAAKDYLGAVADLTTAIQLNPNTYRAYSMRGAARQALADFDGAIDDYGIQVANKGGDGLHVVHARRAQCHMILGHLDIARADAEEAVRLDPKYPFGQRMLGVILSTMDEHGAALMALNKAVELRPDHPDAYNSRIWVHLELGSADAALRDADRLVAIKPDNAFGHLVRAALLDLIDRPEAAEAAYRETIILAKKTEDNRSWYYGNLLLDVLASRLGRKNRDYLNDVLDWPDDWPKRIALHLSGRVTAESLLVAARQTPSRMDRLNQECEANFYIGMALWAEGKGSAAEPYLQIAALPRYDGNMEQTMARKLLKRPEFLALFVVEEPGPSLAPATPVPVK